MKKCDHLHAVKYAETTEEIGGVTYTILHLECPCGKLFARYGEAQ